jgi:DnaJ-class molecular chaperone
MFKFKVDSSNFKKALDVCPECNGFGQTGETVTIFVEGKTLHQGSGCPVCKGLGKLLEGAAR